MSRLEGAIHRRLIAASADAAPTLTEIAELVRAEDPLRPAREVDRSAAEISARLVGLGQIDRLMADPLVTDVMVNGDGPVWIEREGRLEVTDLTLSAADVHLLVERIMAPQGRRADRVHCLADGRLADGSRVHVVMPRSPSTAPTSPSVGSASAPCRSPTWHRWRSQASCARRCTDERT